MYKKDKPITLKGSTSFLCNNLAVNVVPEKKQLNYAVVHKSVVNITCATTDGSSVTGRQVAVKEPSATQGLPFVMQAKWVVLPSRSVLVLTTQRGIQMYEADGSALIYWHALSETVDKSNFGKGICGAGDNMVCVGTESGAILVFDMPSKGTNVTVLDTVKGHKSPITDLTSEGEFMVSADDLGTIMVWRCSGSKFTQVSCIRGSGWPCNSLAIWKDTVVAGFASGHLRVYSLSTGTLGAEVTAHARAINAVDVASENGLVLSVSDDTYLRIWQLKAGPQPQIEHRHSECVGDLQLVGAHFVDKQGRALCITGYDNNEIQFYVKG